VGKHEVFNHRHCGGAKYGRSAGRGHPCGYVGDQAVVFLDEVQETQQSRRPYRGLFPCVARHHGGARTLFRHQKGFGETRRIDPLVGRTAPVEEDLGRAHSFLLAGRNRRAQAVAILRLRRDRQGEEKEGQEPDRSAGEGMVPLHERLSVIKG
jgi:hypothetical protein